MSRRLAAGSIDAALPQADRLADLRSAIEVVSQFEILGSLPHGVSYWAQTGSVERVSIYE